LFLYLFGFRLLAEQTKTMFDRNRHRCLQPKVISRLPKSALRIFFANKTGWRYLKYDYVTGGFTNKTDLNGPTSKPESISNRRNKA